MEDGGLELLALLNMLLAFVNLNVGFMDLSRRLQSLVRCVLQIFD